MFMFVLGAVFLFFGFAVHKLKWYFLISGFNTMSKEKKVNVNVEGLGRWLGLYGYILGLLFFLVGVLYILDVNVNNVLFVVIFVALTIFFLVKAQKYDGNLYDEQGKLRPGGRKKVLLTSAGLLVVFIGVCIMLYYFTRPVEVATSEQGIEIEGAYGGLYDWDSISKVELLDELPTIGMRTNGAGIGSHLTGHFKTDEYGSVKLFVDTDTPPFILLESEGEIVILNLETEKRTKELFNDIKKRIK